MYRDVEYDDYSLVVELDGRTGHEDLRSRDEDMDRDLDAAVDGNESVRVSWGQAAPPAPYVVAYR